MIKYSYILMVVISLAFRVTTYSQSIGKLGRIDRNPVQTNYINTKDSIIRFQTTAVYASKDFNRELIYYWYKNNMILKTTGAADGRILCGDYTSFYPDNNLKEKGQFVNGLKDGAWITWFSNGKMKELFSWKKGVLHGKHIQYDEDGTEVLVETYRNGKIHVPAERKKLFPFLGKKNDATKGS